MIVHEEIVMETLPDPFPDTSYLEQDGFEERLRQAQNGDFGFMGVRASCTVLIGIGQSGHVIAQRIDSPGIWGVETDSDPAHVRELYDAERNILLAMLDAMGCKRAPGAEAAN